MSVLLSEAEEHGSHSLKRTLGVFQLTALGVGAVIGAGIFVLSGLGRALRRTRPDAFVRAFGPGLRLRRTLLRGIRRHDSAGRQRLYLRVRHARRVLRLDHRLGSDARIRHGRQHGFFRLVESLHRTARHLPHQNAAVAGLRSLDGSAQAQKHHRAADGAGLRSDAGSRHAGLPRQVCRYLRARSPRNCCSARTIC